MFHTQYYASDGMSAGGLFQWKRDIGPDRAYSLDPADYPRLPLFTWKGAKGSTAYLNAVFWLVFDSVSTWRTVLQLYCNVANMEDLADSVYYTIPAAMGSICPALPAAPKISKNLVAYIAGMLVTAPSPSGQAIDAPMALLRHTSVPR